MTPENLWTDLLVVLRHIHTFPFMFGTPCWHLWEKKRYQRPTSEFDLRSFPVEYVRIVFQMIETFPVVFLYAALIVTVVFHRVSGFQAPVVTTIGWFREALAWTSRVRRQNSPNSNRDEDSGGVLPKHTATAVLRVKTTQELGEPELQTDQQLEVPEQQVCYYINGVLEQGAMTQATADILEARSGRVFNLITNHSDGPWLDLAGTLEKP